MLIHILGLPFHPQGRSRVIYGDLLKVKQFQSEEIKVDGAKNKKAQRRRLQEKKKEWLDDKSQIFIV